MRQLSLPLALALCLSGGVQAQTTDAAPAERIGVFGDWAVFSTTQPRECYATTLALEESAWAEGETPANAAQLLVTYRPSDDPLSETELPGELSFWAGGRAIAQGSSLTGRFEGAPRTQVTLFTDGRWAWPLNAEHDLNAVGAMKEGGQINIALMSAEMSAVAVTFSLEGFADAAARAAEHCANMGNLGNLAGPAFTPWSAEETAPASRGLLPNAGPEF